MWLGTYNDISFDNNLELLLMIDEPCNLQALPVKDCTRYNLFPVEMA